MIYHMRRFPAAIAGVLGILALLGHPVRAQQPSPSASASASAAIIIDASKPLARISPLLYGQFMEFMFEGVKGGLSAELLRDRGFEGPPNAIGLPADWARYPDDRADDYGLNFRRDDSAAFAVDTFAIQPARPPHSLRVDAGGGVVERHGLFQSRVPVRGGLEYRGYVWIRGGGYQGPVVVALEPDRPGARPYAEARIDGVGGDWKKYEFTLRPSSSDALARFAILFPGRGRLWLDQASLMPGDARDGVRADVEQRVAALKPAFFRWPGGNVAQDYHWRWGVGPRDRRPEWVNLSWKNELENGDIGTDEYIAFARRVGAEPTLTVNVEGRGGTPEEAAAWVEYCNGPASSRYGGLRAANGHPQPFGVRYWEIGNEIWGDWVRGHSDAATYAANLTRYVAAMKAVDPTIRIIAVGDNDMAWNRMVLSRTAASIDFLAVHHYYGTREAQGDPRNFRARPLHYEGFYRELGEVIRNTGRDIKLAINEWGLDLPESRQWSMEAAVYGARLMNVFERSAPLVAMSAVSDLINGWPGGIIQAARDSVFVTPAYHVNRLYATHLGRDLLAARVTSPTFDSGREGTGIQVLDATASRSSDGKSIYIKAVNTDPSNELPVRVEVSGASIGARAEVDVLSGPPGAWNSFAAPDGVSPKHSTIAAGKTFTFTMPAQSVAVITLSIQR